MQEKKVLNIAIICSLFSLINTKSCLADEIQLRGSNINATVEGKERVIKLFLDKPIPLCESDSVTSLVLNKNNYNVTLDIPDQSGIIIPSNTEDGKVNVKKVEYGQDFSTREIDCQRINITLQGIGYGQGKIKIKKLKVDDNTSIIGIIGTPSIDPNSEICKDEDDNASVICDWQISEPIKDISDSTFKANLSLNNLTPVVGFSYAYSTDLDVTEGNISRWWFNAEGSIPIETPSDVDETPGAETDASEEVADFIQASFRRSWSNGFNLQSLGIILRTSGRFNGIEAVGTYQPWQRFFAGGRIFTGLEGEIGYRSGTDEFENLTQRAPDRGNFLGRIGAVVEYAPELGPINRDLGSGLRFFVRGRGWTDLADNDDGDTAIRLRGFLDSEFFYNISDSSRVFLRYELGKIPPDLSNNVERLSVGFGVAF